jgi:3-phenylpropionate/trans-cinnamate dioxygenase ferredoxin reductase component
MRKRTFVIVGASLAGAKAAEELREQGFDGRVVLIGAEPERPYERPPLTKDYLRGESERDKADVHPEGWYAEQQVELLSGVTVREIDPRASNAVLGDDTRLAYDALLLTTGAEPRRISVPGAGLDGIYYLRTLADCDALRARLDGGGRVAVVGAGWIGSEFAASARELGLEVSVIDPVALPNERIFGERVGAFYRDVHLRHGVEMLLGRGVSAFEGERTVTGVRMSDGASVECDFAVIGVGVAPRTALADDAGLSLDNGVAVDERLVTSVPNIFAAGDVASAWHPSYGRRIRVEHWANALNQGPAAARSMLGQGESYARIPYFFSDQYDVGMEYSG